MSRTKINKIVRVTIPAIKVVFTNQMLLQKRRTKAVFKDWLWNVEMQVTGDRRAELGLSYCLLARRRWKEKFVTQHGKGPRLELV
jgi:hypothetical protein